MKRLYLAIFTVSMFLIIPALAIAGGEYAPDTRSAPSVGQQVIREGDYAVELVQALKISPQQGEADAETALANLGITPKSGWISDFPVTPDIVVDIQASIDAAADAGRLPIGKADAEQAFVALNTEIGIDVTPAEAGNYAGDEAYTEPTVIENYYYDEGPPIVTYYAPPPDYAYLYAWDPFPFWWGGFWFPGYYVLNDFDFAFFDFDHDHFRHFGHDHFGFHDRADFRFYRDHREFWHGNRQLSNHVIDPVTRRAVAIDPISRRPFTRTAFRPVGARSFDPVARTAGHGRIIGNAGIRNGGGQFNRSFNRTSAANIVNRSTGRVGTASFGRSATGFRRDAISGGRPSGSFNRPARSFNRPAGSYNRPAYNPGFRGSYERSPMSGSRSFSGSRGYSGGGGRSFGGGGGRSFGGGGGRSFGGGGGGRSFGGGGFGGRR